MRCSPCAWHGVKTLSESIMLREDTKIICGEEAGPRQSKGPAQGHRATTSVRAGTQIPTLSQEPGLPSTKTHTENRTVLSRVVRVRASPVLPSSRTLESTVTIVSFEACISQELEKGHDLLVCSGLRTTNLSLRRIYASHCPCKDFAQ